MSDSGRYNNDGPLSQPSAGTKKKAREGMTKDKIPENFSLGLALVDAVPVLFFGINCLLIGRLWGSPLFMIGSILCLLGGGGKVLWKIIVALCRKNIWFLFVQMRIVMPVGFLLMIIAVFVDHAKIDGGALLAAVTGFPVWLFLALGVLGMGLMGVFAVKLDNSDLKSNWIEQLTNGVSQIMFFIALLCCL